MDDTKSNNEKESTSDADYRLKAGLFFTAVSGISACSAFAFSLAAAKKKDPHMFEKGGSITKELPESGVQLAMRALKWGTIYSFTGCGLIFYGIWKLSGAHNFQEFRSKMGSVLPRISNNEPPKSRTEFSGINDLFHYLAYEYGKPKTDTESEEDSCPEESGEASTK